MFFCIITRLYSFGKGSAKSRARLSLASPSREYCSTFYLPFEREPCHTFYLPFEREPRPTFYLPFEGRN